MTALAANIEIPSKFESGVLSGPVVASDIIYKGALLKQNAAGNIAPCVAEAGSAFAGVAYEYMDNSAGAAGDKEVRYFSEGVFLLNGTGFALTDVGQPVYATDDQVVTKTSAANAQVVGQIVQIKSSTQVWVKLATGVSPGLGS